MVRSEVHSGGRGGGEYYRHAMFYCNMHVYGYDSLACGAGSLISNLVRRGLAVC